MIRFSPRLSEALTYFDTSPHVLSRDESLVSNLSFWTYTLFEGEIPEDSWFDQFISGRDRINSATLKSAYVAQGLGKDIASIAFNAPLHRSKVLPNRRSLSASSSSAYGLKFRFNEEGTPNWFMVCQYSSSKLSSTVGEDANFTGFGQVGVDKDLYITKSPVTEYSEITLSDISLDHSSQEV